MRKYVLNFTVISAFVGAFTLIKTSKNAPRDWRLALLWIGWLVTLANAFAAVSERADQKEVKAEGGESKLKRRKAGKIKP
jgi:hypothetical protein